MTNIEIAGLIEPWYPVFARIFGTALSDTLAVAEVIGNPRPTERANIFHAAVRDGMRALCEKYYPVLRLVEEPDGKGLDYVVLTVGERCVAIRWGKYDGVRINRNSTHRQTDIQQQGCFPFYMETDAELPAPTIGYILEDDYTEAGRPCWWISRLALLREKNGRSDFIQEVARFTQRDSTTTDCDEPSPRIVLRDDERQRMLALADEVFRKIG